jgi:hypothetical protein
LGTALSGCTAQPQTQAREQYILAARYDMGNHRSSQTTDRFLELQQNLQRFNALGFNTVLFDYLEDARRTAALDAAAQAGLRAYLTDRDVHYYLLTGKLRGADNLDTLITTKIKPLAQHPAFAGVAILSGYSKERASAIASALRSARINFLTPGQSGYSTNGGAAVAWLDANNLAVAPISQIERLLLELNSELYAGWNDGLVIDFAPDPKIAEPSVSPSGVEFRSDGHSSPYPFKGEGRGEGKEVQPPPPPEAESEIPSPESLMPASNPRSRIYAVESLLRRAGLWGARLKGFERQVIPPDGIKRDPALMAAVFVRDARRYLFLFNQSSEPVRGPIRFAATFSGKPVARAVGIPATADRIAGDVFATHGTELSVNVNLRPGDAALFELF